MFHRLIAEWQLTGERPSYTEGVEVWIDLYVVKVDPEMYAQAEACLERYDAIPGKRYVEVKVDISDLTPLVDQTGTADRIHVSPGVIEIIDWKYGKGVKVFAKYNTQLLCYAWGAFRRFDDEYDIQTIRMHIAQPRLDHFEVWEITREELLEFAVWARQQWNRAWRDDAVRIPSAKACQWCRIRVRCPARQAALERVVDETFEPVPEIIVTTEEQTALIDPALEPPLPPAELTTERLAWIYGYRRSFELWFKEIGEELIRRGLEGDPLGGLWKVVEGRQGNRAWTSETVAAMRLERLGIDPWKHELVSPAEIERRLAQLGVKGKAAKQYLALLTDRAPGKPALVPTTDNRLNLTRTVDEILSE